MRNYMAVLWLFVMMSCSSSLKNNNKDITNVKQIDTLKSFKEIDLLFPRQINVVDKYIIITNREENNFFDIYDGSVLCKLDSFGEKGKGPGEFILPTIYDIKSAKDGIILNIYDVFKRTDTKINFNKILDNVTETPSVELMPNDLGIFEKIIYKSNDTLIYSPDNEVDHARLCIHNGMEKCKINYIPKIDYDINEKNYYPIYNTVSSCYNDSLSMFAVTSIMLGQLDYFTMNGEYIRSAIVEKQEQLKYACRNKIIHEYNPIQYQTELKCLNGFIYMLFSKSLHGEPIGLSEIYKLDWEGNAIKKFVLNEVSISFDISPNGEYLYAITFEENGYKLKRFNLNEKV